MEEGSILKSIRARFNLAETDDSFDHELIPAINTALGSLYSVGYGSQSFVISGDTELWSSLFGSNPNVYNIKSYIFFKVKLEFDPPTSSYGITAIKEQLSELEFRISSEHDTSLEIL